MTTTTPKAIFHQESPLATPSLLRKRSRSESSAHSEGEETSDDNMSGEEQPLAPLDPHLFSPGTVKHFGLDDSWAGCQFFSKIRDRDDMARCQGKVFVWLVFATAIEHNFLFGPKDCYNVKSLLGVSNFVIEQWSMRPEQIDKHPSDGRTFRFLLTFDIGDAVRLAKKVPNGWIKLGKGIGCKVVSPSYVPRKALAFTIIGVPAIWPIKELTEWLEAEPWVKQVLEVERVELDNRVRTDRVNGRLVPQEGLCLPYDPTAQEVRVQLDWDGFSLVMERRVACYTCGEEEHTTFDCLLKQKLLAEEKGWAYTHIEEVEEPSAAGQGNVPAQGSSTAKADAVGQTGGEPKKRKRSRQSKKTKRGE
ncbi:hypothetical protein BU15DRAFT_84146 [Melanogaster broomeanus]|nr:hypothetical protein BU15DRAFT_84146 [Melanogaster broomeanus]